MIENKLNYELFESGADDARSDISGGWLPEPFTLDFIVNELRIGVGATDAYLAGYLSVVYGSK